MSKKPLKAGEIRLGALRAHPKEASPILHAAERVYVHAYTAQNANGQFYAAFCIGDGLRFSEVGNAVLERVTLHAVGKADTIVMNVTENKDGAQFRVKQVLQDAAANTIQIFACKDSATYDYAIAPIFHDLEITLKMPDGKPFRRLTPIERMSITPAATRKHPRVATSKTPT